MLTLIDGTQPRRGVNETVCLFPFVTCTHFPLIYFTFHACQYSLFVFLTILWGICVFLVLHDFKVEAEQVDGDGVFSGVILLASSEEGLSEKEPGHPEHCRRSIHIPTLCG